MREILFRGKRLDDGAWVYGWYCKYKFSEWPLSPCIIPSSAEEDGYLQHIKVDPATVGQYTGLTDKNGVKIFEGDIVKAHYKNAIKADFVEYVVFHKGRFCATPDDKHIWAGLADGIKHPPDDKGVYMEWCEIIGNIHDNPELLGGGAADA